MLCVQALSIAECPGSYASLLYQRWFVPDTKPSGREVQILYYSVFAGTTDLGNCSTDFASPCGLVRLEK